MKLITIDLDGRHLTHNMLRLCEVYSVVCVYISYNTVANEHKHINMKTDKCNEREVTKEHHVMGRRMGQRFMYLSHTRIICRFFRRKFSEKSVH
jgi:hypothetical protein